MNITALTNSLETFHEYKEHPEKFKQMLILTNFSKCKYMIGTLVGPDLLSVSYLSSTSDTSNLTQYYNWKKIVNKWAYIDDIMNLFLEK